MSEIKSSKAVQRFTIRALPAAILTSVFLTMPLNAEVNTVVDFDFYNNDVSSGFGPWRYEDKGSNDCLVYDGAKQSKFCTDDGGKLYLHYKPYNSDHLGWYRYAFMGVDSEYSVSGTGLRVTYTGGAYADEQGQVQWDGLPVHSLTEYQEHIQAGNLPYSNRNLPGDAGLQFNFQDPTANFPALQGANRLSVWVLMPQGSIAMDDYSKQKHNARPDQNFAWYPFPDRSTGGHYYHRAHNIAMGSWTHFLFDAHPTHHNGGNYNPFGGFQEGGKHYPGDGRAYFSNIASFSFRPGITINMPSPTFYVVDEVEAYYEPYQNEETIISLGVGFDPTSKLFDISLEDKYLCAECASQYEVRYAFEPISNANFSEATLPKQVINYDRNHNNVEGKLIKPANGYNALWGALELQDEDKLLLTEGKQIYFAVKDISDRSAITQDSRDFELVTVPSVGDVRRMDLIKTIDYKIFNVVYPVKLPAMALPDAVQGQTYLANLSVSGGLPPYTFELQQALPSGLQLTSTGSISGTPDEFGTFPVQVKVTDASGSRIDSQTYQITIIQDPVESCAPACSRFTLVDFASENSQNQFGFYDWEQVLLDRYTGYFEHGATTVVGTNGDYNFQGISGSEHLFTSSDSIILTWYNHSDQAVQFTPKISFDDPDRPTSGVEGNWEFLSQVKLSPNSSGYQLYSIPENMAGSHSLVNINVNFDQNRMIELDKIELVTEFEQEIPIEEAPIDCQIENQCVTELLVDFGDSSATNEFGSVGWTTVIKDVYTDYGQTGTTIVIGNNGQYNYQGISGVPIQLNAGEFIKVNFVNQGATPITFTPKVSLDDPDRMTMGTTGNWHEMTTVTLEPGSSVESEFLIPAQLAGLQSLVNVSVNTDNSQTLEVDAIYWQRMQ